jgi:5-methylcytosine-specific restriction endonuclease McrA
MENFNNIDDSNLMGSNGLSNSDRRIVNSGKNGTKRSVSETKKKYVASMQDWKCGQCKKKLTHTFEVDHKIRLEHGGGNDVSNLVALCRECHGEKTAMENM